MMISIVRMRGWRTYNKGINLVVIGLVGALLVLSVLVVDQSATSETSGTPLSEKCDMYKNFNDANETPTALLDTRQAGQEDWFVTTTQVVENEVRTQTGNITIMESGSLTLYNTTLLVNSSADAALVVPYYIDVRPGGKLYVYGGSNITANTIHASSSTWTFVDSPPQFGPKAIGSIGIEIKVYDGATTTETWNVICAEPSAFAGGKPATFKVIGSVSGSIGTFTGSKENWGWSEWFNALGGQLSVRVRNPQFNAEEWYDYTLDDLFKFDTTSATTRPYMFYVRAGAIFEMRNSELHHCGWNNINKGLTIETDSAIIDSCTISENYFGLTFEECTGANKITNCNISNNARGIYLRKSSENIISNCNINSNEYEGICIESSSFNSITNCDFSSSKKGDGILISDSSDTLIKDCNISLNSGSGIYIWHSFTDNTIQNCTISNNTYGIYSSESHNDTILNCTILNNSYGIYFNGTQNDTLRNNALFNNTYNFKAGHSELQDFYHDIDTSNTINGKKMYYQINKNNQVFNGSAMDIGYLGLVSCNNITVKNLNVTKNGEGLLLANATNVTVTNSNFSYNDYGVAFHCDHSNSYIENCKIFSNSYGVLFSKSSNNYVKNCEISNNYYGIHFNDASSNNYIENCKIFSNSYGVNLSSSSNNHIVNCQIYSNSYNGVNISASSSNNYIEDCKIFSNSYGGIFFDKSSNSYNHIIGCEISNSYNGVFISSQSNNYIENCKIFSNSYAGINIDASSNNYIKDCEISNSYVGIFITQSSNSYIENCKIFSNSYAGINITAASSNSYVKNCKLSNSYGGIFIRQSSNSYIENCDFLSNSYGVYIAFSSNNNNISHNNFVNNTNQAYDECSNYWDNGTEGNYWSDYAGTDANGDGIGDTAYNILGGTNKDYHPLMKPWYAPVFLLEPGWNFVTLPSNSSIQNAEALANAIDNCTHVARWNNITKSLEVHQKGTTENNFIVEGLQGYFVYVSQSSYFNPGGSKTKNISLTLKQGWNSIGWFNITNTNVQTLAQNITNCTAISYWNNTLGRFITYVVGANICNFAIERGNAYLVFVTSDGTWVNG